uniref:Ionotropic glutamate receptor L-glutamate and glycine-binding domain-containing protein n=1 Tax=Strigamia maritima TaxID=126957 RepID=T1JMA0_STRMM
MEVKYFGYRWIIKEGRKMFLETQILQFSCSNQFAPSSNIMNNLSTAVKVSTFMFPPCIFLKEKNNTTLIKGYFGELFSIFNQKFNISFDTKINKRGVFGKILDGKWNGIMGDIVHGTANIATCLPITRMRRDYVDFSPALYKIHFKILYRKLDHREWPFNYYLKAFTKNLWLSIFAINLIIIVALMMENSFVVSITGFVNEILLCWPIVLVGTLTFSSRHSMKLCIFIYLSLSMLLLSIYTSLLTALFATSKIKIPFHSIEEMVYNTDYIPLCLPSSTVEEIFKILFNNAPFMNVRSIKEGIDVAFRQKAGFIATTQVVAVVIGTNCSLTFAAKPMTSVIMAVAFSKHFAHKNFFDFKIIQLKECGLLHVLYSRYIDIWHDCIEDSLFYSISFGQILGPVVVFTCGILLSLVIGLIEVLIVRF